MDSLKAKFTNEVQLLNGPMVPSTTSYDGFAKLKGKNKVTSKSNEQQRTQVEEIHSPTTSTFTPKIIRHQRYQSQPGRIPRRFDHNLEFPWKNTGSAQCRSAIELFDQWLTMLTATRQIETRLIKLFDSDCHLVL